MIDIVILMYFNDHKRVNEENVLSKWISKSLNVWFTRLTLYAPGVINLVVLDVENPQCNLTQRKKNSKIERIAFRFFMY